MKLTYSRLLVTDFDSCFEFYSSTLNLKVTWGKPGEVYASFETGSATALSIFSKELMLQSLGYNDDVSNSSPQQVLCFETDNVDRDYDELSSKGVTFITEPKDVPGWGIRCAHLKDPEGNIIELNQELPMEQWSDDLKESIPADN